VQQSQHHPTVSFGEVSRDAFLKEFWLLTTVGSRVNECMPNDLQLGAQECILPMRRHRGYLAHDRNSAALG
jgi:hypothetical protein